MTITNSALKWIALYLSVWGLAVWVLPYLDSPTAAAVGLAAVAVFTWRFGWSSFTVTDTHLRIRNTLRTRTLAWTDIDVIAPHAWIRDWRAAAVLKDGRRVRIMAITLEGGVTMEGRSPAGTHEAFQPGWVLHGPANLDGASGWGAKVGRRLQAHVDAAAAGRAATDVAPGTPDWPVRGRFRDLQPWARVAIVAGVAFNVLLVVGSVTN